MRSVMVFTAGALLVAGCASMTYTPPPLSLPPKVDAWVFRVSHVPDSGFVPTQLLASSRVRCESMRAGVHTDDRNYKLVPTNCMKVTVMNGKGNSGWWGYWMMPVQDDMVGIAEWGGIQCDRTRAKDIYNLKPAYPVSSCVPMEIRSE